MAKFVEPVDYPKNNPAAAFDRANAEMKSSGSSAHPGTMKISDVFDEMALEPSSFLFRQGAGPTPEQSHAQQTMRREMEQENANLVAQEYVEKTAALIIRESTLSFTIGQWDQVSRMIQTGIRHGQGMRPSS